MVATGLRTDKSLVRIGGQSASRDRPMGEGKRVPGGVPGENRMTGPDRRPASVFLSMGIVTGILALFCCAVPL